MVLQEPIAVIGYDLMFPGDASTPAGFAEILAKGRSAHGEIPKDRWNPEAFYHPDPHRAGSVRTYPYYYIVFLSPVAHGGSWLLYNEY